MRNYRLGVLTFFAAISGCTSGPTVADHSLLTGTVCKETVKCISADTCMPPTVAIAVDGGTAPGICSRSCQTQADCPEDFDCVLSPLDASNRTCYKRSYDSADKGGFGMNCATVSAAPKSTDGCVAGAKSPCSTGFTCVSSAKCDNDAYCSRECKGDWECPYNYFCGTIDDKKVCLKRAKSCSPCAQDEDCGSGYLCSSTDHVCLQACGTQKDCPAQPNMNGTNFQTCKADGARKLCTPTSSPCHGPSPLKAKLMGDGTNTVCSVCRVGFPEDCGSGLSCFCHVTWAGSQTEACGPTSTGEAFCSKPCTVQYDADANGIVAKSDSCATEFGQGARCTIEKFTQGCSTGCKGSGYCSADYSTFTCYSAN